MWLALTVFGIGLAAACAMFSLVLMHVWPLVLTGGNAALLGWTTAWPLMLTWPMKCLFGYVAQNIRSHVTVALSLTAVGVISCIEAFAFNAYAPAWLSSGTWYLLVAFSTAGVCIGVHLLAILPSPQKQSADPFLTELRHLAAADGVPGVVAHADGGGFTASQIALATVLGISASTVNGRLKDLQALGLIEKWSDHQGTSVRFSASKIVPMLARGR